MRDVVSLGLRATGNEYSEDLDEHGDFDKNDGDVVKN